MRFAVLGTILMALMVLICPIELSAKDETVNFKVKRSDYLFSTLFDMVNDKRSYGTIVKSVFHIAKHYDAYDRYGLYEGQGICRMVTLGLLYAWATEIDLYDIQGTRMGMIDGRMITDGPAKFSFYDADDKQICVACLDNACTTFVLADPENPSIVLARLTHPAEVDEWEVTLYSPERLPIKFLKVFAAFVSDSHGHFRALDF